MGARPVLALNIAALPPQLPIEVTSRIMLGLAEKVRGQAVIAGGHTIQDKAESWAGGGWLCAPRRLLTKAGARPGDVLVLTAARDGCITTAAKNVAQPDDIAAATEWMVRLNRAAAEAATSGRARSEDITGFGFLGHATEMADASGVTLRIDYDRIEFLPGARSYADQWIFPGRTHNNAEALAGRAL